MSTMNRLHNCTNPHQGKAKRVLCLYSAGLLRSPTTAVVLQREYGYMDPELQQIILEDYKKHGTP